MKLSTARMNSTRRRAVWPHSTACPNGWRRHSSPNEIYQIVLEEMQTALNVQYSGLMLIQDDYTSRLALSTHPMDDPLPDLRIPVLGNPIAEYVIETHRPYVSEDLSQRCPLRVYVGSPDARATPPPC